MWTCSDHPSSHTMERYRRFPFFYTTGFWRRSPLSYICFLWLLAPIQTCSSSAGRCRFPSPVTHSLISISPSYDFAAPLEAAAAHGAACSEHQRDMLNLFCRDPSRLRCLAPRWPSCGLDSLGMHASSLWLIQRAPPFCQWQVAAQL